MKGKFSIINSPAMLNKQMPAEEILAFFCNIVEKYIFCFRDSEGLVINNTDLQTFQSQHSKNSLTEWIPVFSLVMMDWMDKLTSPHHVIDSFSLLTTHLNWITAELLPQVLPFCAEMSWDYSGWTSSFAEPCGNGRNNTDHHREDVQFSSRSRKINYSFTLMLMKKKNWLTSIFIKYLFFGYIF